MRLRSHFGPGVAPVNSLAGTLACETRAAGCNVLGAEDQDRARDRKPG